MNELLVCDELYDELYNEKLLQKIVEEAEEEMISYYCNASQHDNNLRSVSELYKYYISMGRFPSFDDIIEDIYSHNSTLVWKIAEAQYELEGWHGPIDPNSSEDDIADAREDTISMLCENWESYYCDHLYPNLDTYTEGLLEELDLSYYYDTINDIYSENQINDGIIFANDCQNILFEEFMLEVDTRFLFVVSKGGL
jgi:hypothetical protein